ncbi:MAG: hypothetical protein Q4F57_02495 [Weeksellaceae bacterium]|nr:hypothetical protein [Weeksellaceae bacterium]
MKQGEYLKTRLSDTEKALASGDALIAAQREAIEQHKSMLLVKEGLLHAAEAECSALVGLKDIEIHRLSNVLAVEKTGQRAALWQGVKYGSITTIIAVALGYILLH